MQITKSLSKYHKYNLEDLGFNQHVLNEQMLKTTFNETVKLLLDNGKYDGSKLRLLLVRGYLRTLIAEADLKDTPSKIRFLSELKSKEENKES